MADTMKRARRGAAALGLLLGAGGCAMGGGAASGADMLGGLAAGRGAATGQAQRPGLGGMQDLMARQKLQMEMMNNPDLPAWHAQREKMALALGDRVFDKPFDAVFDGLTVAVATLGARVQNMERGSGYLAAAIPALEPARAQALQDAALREYAAGRGYPPSVFEGSAPFGMDVRMDGMMQRQSAGMTISLLRQGRAQTKVKLRFDNVYYPEQVAEYYKRVWAAVDRQMFLDRGLD
ncbi:hypothetical protein [Piscinibacter sp.]|uniref:hypothetical protein n=1 Tax=Piscinibacter sp. TaxID=1903157 RepID=UPI0039E5B6D5